MTKTISQKLRELGRKPMVSSWTNVDLSTWDVVDQWRDADSEEFSALTDEEWLIFCNLVACALESEQ